MNPQHRINKLANRKRRLEAKIRENQSRNPSNDALKKAQAQTNADLLARLNAVAEKLLTP